MFNYRTGDYWVAWGAPTKDIKKATRYGPSAALGNATPNVVPIPAEDIRDDRK